MSDAEKKQQEQSDTSNAGSEDDAFASSGCGPMPPVDFATFILSLSTQALFNLGEVVLPEQEPMMDLRAAKQTIGIVEMLKVKTKDNLSDSEAKLIDNLINDMRMRYVMVCQKSKDGSK